MAGCTTLRHQAVSTQVSYNPDSIFVLRQAFNEAGKAGDIDTMMSMLADDVVMMPPNDTTLYGRAECREWWEEYY